RTYKKREPTLEAPKCSKLRAFVNDNKTPHVVAIITTQKKPLVREYLAAPGKCSVKKGTKRSAPKCDNATAPKATPRIIIHSLVPYTVTSLSFVSPSILLSRPNSAEVSARRIRVFA